MIVRLAAPLKPSDGVKTRPFNAALMLAAVPMKVADASPVPVPLLKLSPAVPDRVIVPLPAVSVISRGLESTSLTLIAWAPASVSGVLNAVLCAPGMLLIGGWLATLITSEAVSAVVENAVVPPVPPPRDIWTLSTYRKPPKPLLTSTKRIRVFAAMYALRSMLAVPGAVFELLNIPPDKVE